MRGRAHLVSHLSRQADLNLCYLSMLPFLWIDTSWVYTVWFNLPLSKKRGRFLIA